ncbi:MAG: hypothetical protein WDW38_000647 [Sanguina aurantia]
MLAATMRAEFVQERLVKDRVHHFRSYPKCFVGEQAVQWMLRSGKVAGIHSIDDALELGTQLMEIGSFHHVVYEHTFKNAYLYYRFTSDDKVPSNARQQQVPLAAFPSGAAPLADLGDGAESKATEEGDSSFKPLKLKEPTDKHRVVFAGHLQALQHRVATLATDFSFARTVTEIVVEEAQELRLQVVDANSRIYELGEQVLAAQAQLWALLQLTALLVVAAMVAGAAAAITMLVLVAGMQSAGLGDVRVPIVAVCVTLLAAVAAAVVLVPQHLSSLSSLSLAAIASAVATATAPHLAAPAAGIIDSNAYAHPQSPSLSPSPSHMHSSSPPASLWGSAAPRSDMKPLTSDLILTAHSGGAPTLSLRSAGSSQTASAHHFQQAKVGRRGPFSRDPSTSLPDASLPTLEATSHASSSPTTHGEQSGGASAGRSSTTSNGSRSSQRPRSIRQRASNLLTRIKHACALTPLSSQAATPPGSAPHPLPPSALPTTARCPTLPPTQQDGPTSHRNGPGVAGQALAREPPPLSKSQRTAAARTPGCERPALLPHSSLKRGSSAAAAAASSTPARSGSSGSDATPSHIPFPGPVPTLQALRRSQCSPILLLANTIACPDLVVVNVPASTATPQAEQGPTCSGADTAAAANSPSLAVNGDEPICFETDLFKGRISLYVAGLASSPEALFEGKKRLSWVAVQGRFKEPVAVSSVTTGQEFSQPFQRLPAPWFVEKVLLQLARKISPSMRVGPLSAPHMLIPMLAAAQLVNVCPEEACGFHTSGRGHRRHRWCAQSVQGRRAVACRATPRQQHVDMASYSLRFGYNYDLSKHLAGQPLQIMCKHEASGRYLYNFAVWHERLVAAQQQSVGRVEATATPEPPTSSAGMGGDGVGEQDGSDPGPMLGSGTGRAAPQPLPVGAAVGAAMVGADSSAGQAEGIQSSGRGVAEGVPSKTLSGQAVGMDPCGVGESPGLGVVGRRGWGQPRLTRPQGLQSVLAVMSDDDGDGSSEGAHSEVRDL